jgi:hypothetical protein
MIPASHTGRVRVQRSESVGHQPERPGSGAQFPKATDSNLILNESYNAALVAQFRQFEGRLVNLLAKGRSLLGFFSL